jgi:hypothetical protein
LEARIGEEHAAKADNVIDMEQVEARRDFELSRTIRHSQKARGGSNSSPTAYRFVVNYPQNRMIAL